jgi:hypothetical protein
VGGGTQVPGHTTGVKLHTNMGSVLLHIIRRDGPRALIRGVLPRMLMQGPASAATFVCYEQVKRLSRRGGEAEEGASGGSSSVMR